MDVKSREVDALGKSSLVVGFEFLTSYTPDIGEIRLEGELLYLSEDTEKLLKMWKKDKKLPEDISIEILNNLFRVCLLKVSNISDELQLPLPLRLPVVTKKPAGSEEPKPEDPAVA